MKTKGVDADILDILSCARVLECPKQWAFLSEIADVRGIRNASRNEKAVDLYAGETLI